MYYEAVKQARRTPNDPGLRDAFAELPRAPIRVIACTLSKSVNHGGIMRVSEAYRVERVEMETDEEGIRDKSGAVGAFDWQPMRWVAASKPLRMPSGKDTESMA